jgi:hypothetical protein
VKDKSRLTGSSGGRLQLASGTLRHGPAGEKKYVHGAFTEQYPAFWLGSQSLEAMQDAGILPEDCAESYPGGLAGAGATGAARPDPCLARRPRAGPGGYPRQRADTAGARVPARGPHRAG